MIISFILSTLSCDSVVISYQRIKRKFWWKLKRVVIYLGWWKNRWRIHFYFKISNNFYFLSTSFWACALFSTPGVKTNLFSFVCWCHRSSFVWERNQTSVVRFHKKKTTVNSAKCEATPHTHDAFCPITRAWRVNCPFDCPIILSNYGHNAYTVILVLQSGW